MPFAYRHSVYAGNVRAALEDEFWTSDAGVSFLRLLPEDLVAGIISYLVPLAGIYEDFEDDWVVESEPYRDRYSAAPLAVAALIQTPLMRAATGCHALSHGWDSAGPTHPPGWSPPDDDDDSPSPAALATSFIDVQLGGPAAAANDEREG